LGVNKLTWILLFVDPAETLKFGRIFIKAFSSISEDKFRHNDLAFRFGATRKLDYGLGRIESGMKILKRVDEVANTSDLEKISQNAAHDVAAFPRTIPTVNFDLSLTKEIRNRSRDFWSVVKIAKTQY
jgi:hypothetical protein